jgi:hypothetical protein
LGVPGRHGGAQGRHRPGTARSQVKRFSRQGKIRRFAAVVPGSPRRFPNELRRPGVPHPYLPTHFARNPSLERATEPRDQARVGTSSARPSALRRRSSESPATEVAGRRASHALAELEALDHASVVTLRLSAGSRRRGAKGGPGDRGCRDGGPCAGGGCRRRGGPSAGGGVRERGYAQPGLCSRGGL